MLKPSPRGKRPSRHDQSEHLFAEMVGVGLSLVDSVDPYNPELDHVIETEITCLYSRIDSGFWKRPTDSSVMELFEWG